jgi:protocatechuate 4,5-dioxygenase, alpha chain
MSMPLDKPYANIPGTTIFDADQARKGYPLNSFCMSLMKAPNRERFKQNERAYLDEWPMSEEQKRAVLARDYNEMIRLGGNIYFLAKIFATDGMSFQYVAALMTGMTQAAYAEMMLSGGRSPQWGVSDAPSNEAGDNAGAAVNQGAPGGTRG